MLRILVIDDEQDFRRILSMVLTKLGYDVVVAEDGEKVWNCLTKFLTLIL